jgi:hypothetical protein
MTERNEPSADFLPVDAIVTVVQDGDAADIQHHVDDRRRPVGAMIVVAVIVLVLVTVLFTLLRGTGPRRVDANPPPYTAPTANLPPIDPPSAGGIASASVKPSASRTPSRSTSPSATAKSARPSAPKASPRLSIAAAKPPPGSLVGPGGKCAKASGLGDQLTLQTCDGSTAQRWSTPGDNAVHAAGGCLDVRNAATTNGSPVQLYVCNRTSAQVWEVRGDGTLRNPNANKCLTADGQSLVIQDCRAADTQVWHLL